MCADPDDMTICDYCAEEIDPAEADDCEPDDTGHCIRCGKPIGDDA